MLIINADDWGRSREATDSALACYQHGRISSATAMVFMSDSARAARVALDANIDVGLHLNFSEAFSDPSTPADLQKAQNKVRRFLRRSKYALILYHPFLRKEFRLLYRAQVAEFSRLYGQDPSHIDGHQHMHLCTNMLIDEIIPLGTKVRRNFSFAPGEKNLIQRAYRRLVDSYLGRRYRLTDYFLALTHHVPLERMLKVIALAKDHSVEVMTHPQLDLDYSSLMAPEFASMIQHAKLASYSAL